MGEFSAATRLTVKALRLYHDEGILVPERIDPFSGYRYYGDASWKRARSVSLLRELGFSHRELKDILQECQEDSDLPRFLARRMGEVERELDRARGTRDRLALYLAALGDAAPFAGSAGDGQEGLDALEKALPEQLIAGIRFKGRYAEVGERFAALFKAAGRQACGAPLALYHDDEYRDEDADIEAAVPVRKEVHVPGGACRPLGAQRVLCIRHRGPYATIGTAYRALFEALIARGLHAATPSRELYLKGPGLILPRDPKRFVTELQIPIAATGPGGIDAD
ncbi:MAG: MerR family transcriptional regulator [Spirochaetes bacterium]|nr:MerR family transcriptional regulator [Spirochaetota bacterium]